MDTSSEHSEDQTLSSIEFVQCAPTEDAPVSYTHLTLPTNREV